MVWFTKKPPRGIAIPKLIIAAHEIGHYLAFREAGITVLRCMIDLAEGGDGFNTVDEPADGQHHGYLVGVMAGVAGERYWCDLYGQRLPDHCRDGTSIRGDSKEFRSHKWAVRRTGEVRGFFSERKAIREAHDLLRDNTKQFRALTELLAVDGELDL